MFKNSVFFKDLLISLNSLVGKSIIIFFSLAFFLGFLLIFSQTENMNYYDLTSLGREIFSFAGIIQFFVLIFLGYLRGLASISQEYNKSTMELLMITGISSREFIVGKALSIFVNISLLFLISLPFLSIGLMLGGVNISDIFLYTLYFVSYGLVAILSGMLLSVALKNQLRSMLAGIVFPFWMLLFVGSFFITTFEFLGIRDVYYQVGETLAAVFFPVFLFDNINIPYLNFFGFDIHYIWFHILIFSGIIAFLYRFISNKLQVFYSLKDTSMDWIIPALVLVLLSFVGYYSTLSGTFVFICLSILYLVVLYLYNQDDSSFLKSKSYLYLALLLLSGGVLMTLFSGLMWYVSAFVLALGIFMSGSYFFIERVFKKTSRGIINISHLLFIFTILFVYPLISSNILDKNLPHFGEQFKIAYYYDQGDELLDNIYSAKKYQFSSANLNSYDWKNYTPSYPYVTIILFYFCMGGLFFLGSQIFRKQKTS